MIYQSFIKVHSTFQLSYRGFDLAQNHFNKALLAAVEESLSSLGDSSKQAILYHLEASFKIKKEHIPSNLTEFTNALEGIFGPGASYLEKLITQCLYEKLGLDLENETHSDFLECMDCARKKLTTEKEMP
jgi:hypothetical protein